MTREVILERAIAYFNGLECPEPQEIVEFALNMVQWHNEELVGLVRDEDCDQTEYYCQTINRIAYKLEKAKP